MIARRTTTALSILVVDDDPRSRRLVVAMLGSRGSDVVEAATCAEATRLCRARRFDVILTDIELPDGSGLEVLDLARASSARTTIVAMTAHASSGDRERFLARGFDAHLPKPLENATLTSVLRRAGARGET